MTDANITIQDLVSSNPALIVKVVTIVGQLDESNVDLKSQDVYKVIDSVPAGKHLNLLFDFAGLEYMNSKSIGYLTDWYSRVTGNEGKVCIANARPNILDILQVVGLTQIITCYSSLEEAKVYVGS